MMLSRDVVECTSYFNLIRQYHKHSRVGLRQVRDEEPPLPSIFIPDEAQRISGTGEPVPPVTIQLHPGSPVPARGPG